MDLDERILRLNGAIEKLSRQETDTEEIIEKAKAKLNKVVDKKEGRQELVGSLLIKQKEKENARRAEENRLEQLGEAKNKEQEECRKEQQKATPMEVSSENEMENIDEELDKRLLETSKQLDEKLANQVVAMNQQMNQTLAGWQKMQEEQQKQQEEQQKQQEEQLQTMLMFMVGQVQKRKELEGIDQEVINTQEDRAHDRILLLPAREACERPEVALQERGGIHRGLGGSSQGHALRREVQADRGPNECGGSYDLG